MRSIAALIILLSIVHTSCDKAKMPGCDGDILTATDLTGFDGCGWVLTDNNQRYEPVNLSDFTISLEEGAEYCVEFIELKNNLSACMVGPIIEITSISKVD